MKTNEIRDAFLDYFASVDHTKVESSSLVPHGDPTLLFTNAGMVQFKDCFLGAEKRAYTRATTCQKCLRISGKHNDLENVGRTARHHTFFEMLGNFSFGDYFKQDAIKYAWQFLTEVMQLPKNRLWVTIFETDDEAAELWKSETDVDPNRILRCGEKDNFWAMGDTGPCGPCSEIHYYLGENVASQSEAEFRKEDGSYLEIWNLVFMQYNRLPDGTLNPLPKPSVDTGMGLERIAAVKQGALANYDTDEFQSIISFTAELCGKKYIGKDYTIRDLEKDEQYAVDTAFRVIADHSRACSFLIADGVNPGSDGRGYVLRRLIRRACRHGRALGFDSAFLFKVCGKVVEILSPVYPELTKAAKRIEKVIRAEEEKFIETLGSGLTILKKEVDKVSKRSSKVLPGSVAFLLHDTYGFPLDLTEDIVSNAGLSVDRKGFSEAMDEQRERSRAARADDTELILQRAVKPLETKFVGYERSNAEYESKILGIFNTDGEIESASEGSDVAIVAAETPFYAESGGQIGDTGRISTSTGTVDIIDTKKAAGGTIVHIGKIVEGDISSKQDARLIIDDARRSLLRLNHSATHLLHLALREVLGDHVQQAGSRVSEHNLRFDFSHFEPVSRTQLEEIESIVNEQVRANHKVVTEVMELDAAKAKGAMALFGEKYGAKVRVVEIGPRSLELCGGTHAERSGDIGFVSIVTETGIAAGVRRVEAVSGPGAVGYLGAKRTAVHELADILRAGEDELTERVSRLVERNKELERSLERFQQKENSSRGDSLTSQVRKLADGTQVLATLLEDASPKQLRELADDLKQRLGSICLALGSVQDGKAIVLTAVTDDLVDRFHAGELVKELTKVVGGKGGGRADMAQAGGGDPNLLESALNRFQELVA
ncbi:MAG: alanine--tRNA ligase [Bdellovibrionales bacterium]|nr:alanine--tRNA ligase [Bdellovibrionales bacterium]